MVGVSEPHRVEMLSDGDRDGSNQVRGSRTLRADLETAGAPVKSATVGTGEGRSSRKTARTYPK